MNRQALIKLLQSNLPDEDVLEILEDIVCKNKNKYQHTDAYRLDYQPYLPTPESQFGNH
jgi:hypothetical protein